MKKPLDCLVYIAALIPHEARMKYVGYILLLLGAVAGFVGLRVWVVFVLAALSTFAFAAQRRQNLRDTPVQLPPNPIADGAFLFGSQLLILFAAYLLGVFIASPGGALFGDFISGRQPGA